ncbi:MAG TPA: TetR/AcrR family transcriptional regulator, partial [Solirubrobacterales bacterium]|nr:TetR/AcrR family transcriptional regulator [Solirubrobacterales bacterium]
AGMSDPRSLSERLAKLPPGRHLLPPDYVSQNQRERILLATATLVAERGYQKTTIELIAKTARVALSTFYEHFEDKESCFLAAFEESVEAAREIFSDLVDPQLSWPQQIATGLEVLLEMVVKEPERAKLCLVEAQAAGSASLARYQAMLESVAAKLREGRALNPRGASLPEGLEVGIAGGLAWLIHQRLTADRPEGLEALLPEMLQVTLTPYVGQSAAGQAAAEAEARRAA